MSLEFESLIQNGSNPSGLSCISPIHSFFHVSCMHHIVALCLVLIVYGCSLRQVLPPKGIASIQTRSNTSPRTRKASNPLIISIQTQLLASALVYCIKTTCFKLLCVAVVEPTSSAWPVIATITRWNPLACVGVDWAMFLFPTMLCLLCLESCQVWLIRVMN